MKISESEICDDVEVTNLTILKTDIPTVTVSELVRIPSQKYASQRK